MDESKLIHFWEKIKIYLRDYTDSTAMQFILSCAGIPELPKQIIEFIFERLDQNCDGLISFDEFIIIFQKRRSTEALQEHNESHSIVNCNVNTLDFSIYEPHGTDSIQADKSIDKEEVAGISRVSTILPNRDLNILDSSLVEVTSIICDELKSLNETLDDDTIQSHISLLREMLTLYQNEQRNLSILIENMKAEKEKMRIDMLEANERANLLAQEIDEHQAQLEKTKESLQKQSQQRYAEITKELSNQLNIEREIDAAALKSKDDQLQLLQRENHDMKNKLINTLQDNQMLEAENGTLLGQIEKLRQSNNDLLTRMKMLDAEHDEIQSLEAKQQEQVDFFVNRIKQLQLEVTLLRDQNDELNAELETLKCYSNDIRQNETLSSLAYDLQLDETPDENRITTSQSFQEARQIDAKVPFEFNFSSNEGQLDTSDSGVVNVEKLRNMFVKNLENVLLTSTKCISEKCALSNSVARLINNLQSNLSLHCSTRDFGKSIASELEMECEKRTHESLRDLVVSKAPKSLLTKRTMMSNSAEDLDDFADQDVKSATQNKTTSLRDYPPRKEEHSAEQCRTNKEKDSSLDITEVENTSKNILLNARLQELEAKHVTEKKQLTERCSELERSLDLLRAEYEECEDYWAAKLEEERQLFEQEQKISDDKLAELINKIAEYEELISPLDKSKNNGRLSPIDEKFNLEQQYIDLEEEFEKWKIKTENEISQKNLEIGDLREKLRLTEQLVTSDSWVQVPDEISLRTLSNLSQCKSSSASSIPSMNEPVENLDLQTSDTNNQTYYSSEHPSSNDSNRLIKQDQIDGVNLNITRDECSTKEVKTTHKDKKNKIYQKRSHVGTKVKENDKCDSDFTWMHNVLMQSLNGVNCHCTQNNTQPRMCCIDPSVLQNLNMKLYAQERKKRQLQHYFKRQQQQVEKILQRIMTQHQTELFELQCLLRNTQERLQVQVQTTVDQADRLANADILVKDLYIENACLTEHIKRLQERCLILSGLSMETTSM
ncbi:Blastoderm-specific protein 25D [Harpegnathos saltator]|uniref:Blastoderm-specific protein 25D n=2 Tax=Harpegnathos saltator TaxID=610380 RepID=E2BLL0_HARSA|nr:Blastoderm-specific protein 25D [Harpegnathos saltator]